MIKLSRSEKIKFNKLNTLHFNLTVRLCNCKMSEFDKVKAELTKAQNEFETFLNRFNLTIDTRHLVK